MKVELSQKELVLLNILLSKEAADLKVEIHHTRNQDYREFLKERERQIINLMDRVKADFPEPVKIYV